MNALVYLGNANHKDIEEILIEENISSIFISDKQLYKKIKDINIQEDKIKNKRFDFTFILFKDADTDTVFSFKKNYPIFSHIAMLTDTNKEWKLDTLLKEMDQEHKYYQKREELSNLLKQCSKATQATYIASKLLSMDCSLEDIEKALKLLKKDVNK